MKTNLCRQPKAKLQQVAGVVMALALGSGTVHASTALERRVLQGAAPHTTAPNSGAKVVAHYVTGSGFLEGMPRNAERLVTLKGPDLDFCMRTLQGLGKPINPPTEWPDYITGSRTDTYVTARYRITYRQNWNYGLNPSDCSLHEVYSRVADLESPAGACKIDLINKTASGQCSMAAHRGAKPLPPMLPEPGPLQVVAGLRCGMRNFIGIDQCIAVDGKMKSFYPTILSSGSDYGFREKATATALDMEVSEGLFAPHLQGGFSVTAKQP